MTEEQVIAPVEPQQPEETQGQQAQPAQEESTSLLDMQDESASGEESAQDAPKAPESYEEFAIPDGATLDSDVVSAFAEISKELNLSQEQAQSMINKVAPVMAARQMEQVKAIHAQWTEEAKADPEIGGSEMPKKMSVAKGFVDKFASDGLKEMIRNSGLGSNPEFLRMCYRAGQAFSQDTFVGGEQPQPGQKKQIYYNSNLK